jgi:hypothetical protein
MRDRRRGEAGCGPASGFRIPDESRLATRALPRGGALFAAVAALGLSASGCMSTAAADPVALACRLEAVAPLVAGGPSRVRMTLRNQGERPLWVLSWSTPFEDDWGGTPFVVRRDGEEVPFAGRLVKRGEPEREDYVEVPAGGEAAATADLSAAYDLSAPGRYEVAAEGPLHDVAPEASALPRPRAAHQPMPLACAPLMLELAAR